LALSRVRRTALAGSAPSAVNSLREFFDTHPADALRLREQVSFMSAPTIGWWQGISASASEHVLLLRDSAQLLDGSFSLDPQIDRPVYRVALEVFLEVLPKVHVAVRNAFANVSTQVQEFLNQKPLIQKYLGYGVVPSRLVDGASVWAPSSLALLNAAHLFYLDGFDVLLERIGVSEPRCLECRSLWAQRVEMWTTKALEDIRG